MLVEFKDTETGVRITVPAERLRIGELQNGQIIVTVLDKAGEVGGYFVTIDDFDVVLEVMHRALKE